MSAVYLYSYQGPYQKATVSFEEKTVFLKKNEINYF
jgi:hypothetical protein